MRQNWSSVIAMCLEKQAHPTVLFYEKASDIVDEDATYEESPAFNKLVGELSEHHIVNLLGIA